MGVGAEVVVVGEGSVSRGMARAVVAASTRVRSWESILKVRVLDSKMGWDGEFGRWMRWTSMVIYTLTGWY